MCNDSFLAGAENIGIFIVSALGKAKVGTMAWQRQLRGMEAQST
jgi:hypothetical protein